jgi:hypothetical protein
MKTNLPKKVRTPFIDSPSAMRLLWARAVSEAVYYLDEVSTEVVPADARQFIVSLLVTRLQFTSEGWLTFDGKKLAHIHDAAEPKRKLLSRARTKPTNPAR